MVNIIVSTIPKFQKKIPRKGFTAAHGKTSFPQRKFSLALTRTLVP
jgi:hypothetical protein